MEAMWSTMWDPFRGRIPFEEGPLAPSIEAATARVAVRCGYRFRQVATIENNLGCLKIIKFNKMFSVSWENN